MQLDYTEKEGECRESGPKMFTNLNSSYFVSVTGNKMIALKASIQSCGPVLVNGENIVEALKKLWKKKRLGKV